MFCEADFPYLNQNEIKDLYLLKIHNKIRNIKGTEEYDTINPLKMYIRMIVIKKRVEDVQMGVESYETKLNLTKPQLMEVLSKLQIILRNNRLGYDNEGMEKYSWTKEDEKKTKKFMDKIEKTLKERRRFKRLELFVGGRSDKIDYRLLVRPMRNICYCLFTFLINNTINTKNDSGLAVPMFKQGEDFIDAINKMMSFLSSVVSSPFPTTNNQLRKSSNLRQQATIHDGKANKIILQGLSTDVYSVTNHHRVINDLWERVQLLMQGTSLTKQERECKLYDAFDKFSYIKKESLHQYYLRFT
nr:hypothetical protein [Tanacetum cinerariifolium]